MQYVEPRAMLPLRKALGLTSAGLRGFNFSKHAVWLHPPRLDLKPASGAGHLPVAMSGQPFRAPGFVDAV